MPKMNISRSIEINAPAESVFEKLNNFNEWTPWSPWLCMEPEARVTVAPDAKSYEWEGNRVGSGNMKVLEETTNEYIKYDLNFLKPWKSHAFTDFKLESSNGSTKVTWNMDSSLPWFLFWMRKSMEAFVGADYERGLDMLKAYVEDGKIASNIEFKGNGQFDGCNYIGVKTTCSLEAIGKQMESDFGKIWGWVEDNKDKVAGDPFTIYHKWDMVKQSVSYTSGIQVKEIPANPGSGFVTGSIPATPIYTLRHVGAYEHLGNAWSTFYTMYRNKEIKVKKKIDPFEFYRNNPAETPREELITDINFALK